MGTPRGEALLAVVGLGPILGEGKASLTQDKREQLGRLSSDVRKACKAFLTGEGWEKPKSPGPVEWKPWVSLMSIPPDPARIKEAAEGFIDPEDSAAYIQQALEAWRYLAAQFPRTMKRQLIGVAAEPPPEVYLYRFRRVYTVLDDPLGLLDQLCKGFINTDEQDAFATIFPTMFAEAQRAFILEAQALKAAHPRWELPRKRWEPLRTFLDIPRRPGYVAELQARFAMPEPQDPRTPGTLPRDPGESSQTPTQRAELR